MGTRRPSKRRTLLRKISYSRGSATGHVPIHLLLAARGIGKKIRCHAKLRLIRQLGPFFVKARFLKFIEFHWVMPGRI